MSKFIIGQFVKLNNIENSETYEITDIKHGYINPYQLTSVTSGEIIYEIQSNIKECIDLFAIFRRYKNYKNNIFYSPVFGNIKIANNISIYGCSILLQDENISTSDYTKSILNNGTFYDLADTECIIWPSKELYKKYPLSPSKAWCEFLKIKKRFRAENGYQYYYITDMLSIAFGTECNNEIDNQRYNANNYFETREAAEKQLNKILPLFNEDNI